ncbi:hypothetical protein Y032_0023g726 [Ancylostoma ceylanicum]|uniref:CCHC-type domain-containing protein n=1 Tax=Ancylostoma ceylanicum TaxID=53326 RepID=A0A016UXQ3_9BILA|nr:hypothetical protein Y032_0023g726 [Ancylostoma ceylanicum]
MDEVNHSGLFLHPERLIYPLLATVNMAEEINKDDESGSESRPVPKVFQLTADELEKLMQSRPGPSRITQSQPKHNFVKTGLARQFEFNSEILDIIRPIAELAPEEDDVKKNLDKAIELLTKRNELLVVADGDVSVFAFYEQHKKAEVTTDPILASFLKKKEKEEPKKMKSQTWKSRRFEPYQRQKMPFRYGGTAWAPAPLPVLPQAYGYYPRMEVQGQPTYPRMENQGAAPRGATPRDMCYRCGRFGHYATDCKFTKRQQ